MVMVLSLYYYQYSLSNSFTFSLLPHDRYRGVVLCGEILMIHFPSSTVWYMRDIDWAKKVMGHKFMVRCSRIDNNLERNIYNIYNILTTYIRPDSYALMIFQENGGIILTSWSRFCLHKLATRGLNFATQPTSSELPYAMMKKIGRLQRDHIFSSKSF